MRPFTTRLLLSLGFLSRIPLPGRVFSANPDALLSESADVFPVAGLIIAILPCLVLATASLFWPPEICAALALVILIASTGALHEDGLADCADAFFVLANTTRRLDIMKDSRIGTFGALALVFVVLLGWTSLTQIIETDGTIAGAVALICAAVISRCGMVWHWHVLPPARTGGLAASQGKPDWNAVVLAAFHTCVVTVPLLFWFFGLTAMIVVYFAAFLLSLVAMIIARAKIGGHTGDTIGFSQKITELAVLLALASA